MHKALGLSLPNATKCVGFKNDTLEPNSMKRETENELVKKQLETEEFDQVFFFIKKKVNTQHNI